MNIVNRLQTEEMKVLSSLLLQMLHEQRMALDEMKNALRLTVPANCQSYMVNIVDQLIFASTPVIDKLEEWTQ